MHDVPSSQLLVLKEFDWRVKVSRFFIDFPPVIWFLNFSGRPRYWFRRSNWSTYFATSLRNLQRFANSVGTFGGWSQGVSSDAVEVETSKLRLPLFLIWWLRSCRFQDLDKKSDWSIDYRLSIFVILMTIAFPVHSYCILTAFFTKPKNMKSELEQWRHSVGIN